MISAINNTSALGAQFRLNRNQRALGTSMRNLSTGSRINSGKDGPAALITKEQLSAQIAALEAESRSIERVNSHANITDGKSAQLSSMMSELKGLVVSSANSGAMSDAEVAANQLQIDSIVSSIERFTGDSITSLEGVSLPDGGNAELERQFSDARNAVRTLRSGAENSMSSGNFEAALNAVDSAISDVNFARGRIGAYQKNTLGPQLRTNEIARENLMDARSRLSDTDFGREISSLNRSQLLVEAGVKVLKIAQSRTGSLLDLLG